MQKVYTTTQVSKLCQVCVRTVSKWVDSGQLKGYRVPGSRARRIPHQHLVSFLLANGMPLGALSPERNVLLISTAPGIFKQIQDALGEHYVLHHAKNGFEAGLLMSSIDFGGVILDTHTPGVEAIISGFVLREIAVSIELTVVAICHPGDKTRAPSEWAHDSFTSPFDPKLLCLRLDGLLSRLLVRV